MSQTARVMLPVGRMVGGSMYKANPKTDKRTNQPMVDAKGQPIVSYSFGVAIPKNTELSWQATPWGAQIKAVGQAANPGICERPDYAWKVIDGDSTIPNTKNKRPCDQDGYKGHWVLWLSQGWAPKLVNRDGSADLLEPDAVVPGYYIEVCMDVKPNGSTDSPGVYLNPVAVALAAFGERIETSGVDTSSLGFGGKSLPAGASAMPPSAMQMPQVAPVAPVPPAPAPNTAILQPPKAMLPAANGVTYEQYRQAGWTDEQLRASGYMQ